MTISTPHIPRLEKSNDAFVPVHRWLIVWSKRAGTAKKERMLQASLIVLIKPYLVSWSLYSRRRKLAVFWMLLDSQLPSSPAGMANDQEWWKLRVQPHLDSHRFPSLTLVYFNDRASPLQLAKTIATACCWRTEQKMVLHLPYSCVEGTSYKANWGNTDN